MTQQLRLTPAQYAAFNKKRKATKYGAVATRVDGIRFDSKKEAARYAELLLLQKAGRVADLALQPVIKCSAGGVHICDYRADFFYTTCAPDPVRAVYEDVKSEYTRKLAVYRLKKKLVLALCGIEIKET